MLRSNERRSLSSSSIWCITVPLRYSPVYGSCVAFASVRPIAERIRSQVAHFFAAVFPLFSFSRLCLRWEHLWLEDESAK